MIVGFGDAATEDLFHGRDASRVRRLPPDVVRTARRKLDMINAAHRLEDLKMLPGNRLEPLSGKLKGYHSIRVNDQWRVVFRWNDGRVIDVSIVDYHK